MPRLLRFKACYGPNGKIPVSRSKFHEDILLNDEREPYVPGTTIRRLRRIPLGPRTMAVDEAEADEMREAFIREARNRSPKPRNP
jgi:hypothetical protein